MFEALLLAVALGLGLLLPWRAARRDRRVARVGLAALVGIASVSALALARRAPTRSAHGPATDNGGAYVSSAACRSCHPSEHASFARTFHRTMTARASPSTIFAPIGVSGSKSASDPHVELRVRAGDVWARDEASSAPEARLVLTTGSHHYQTYWTEVGREGELTAFPFVWLIAERRWLPRHEAFLDPPDAPSADVHWSSNCIQCHAVAGEPRRDDARFSPRVAELGIACEACHGPGREHVARHQDPFERYASRGRDVADPTIVNPARLPADRASEVCGQCHAYAYPRDEEEWWRHGYTASYRPGGELAASRTLLTLDTLEGSRGPRLDAPIASVYWKDGTIRVGGREWNGLALSACRTRGEGPRRISCLSCHAMHDSEPDDQLTRTKPGDAACRGCHEATPPHAHHAEGSAGASCLGCHMPKTSYALLGAIRSHRIDIPRVTTARDTGRPLACNLCHLDKSLGWSQEHLVAWYGAKPAPLEPRVSEVSEAVELALRGDAAQRAIVAASFADPDARRASAMGWEGPILAVLADDPYPAVRTIAGRARDASVKKGGDASRSASPALSPDRARCLLLRSDGTPDREAWDAELRARDDHPVSISE